MYDQMDILALDPDSLIELEYLAEGAANVVYRIRFPPQSPSISSDLELKSECLQSDPRISGKLLRLRKDLPFTVPVIESQKYWESVIYPLFAPQNLVQQALFRPSSTLLKRCNAALHNMESDGIRAGKRYHAYLAEENHGTLITDMTCASTSQHISIEFKPKWLVQSPSAPTGSIRCRTCALRAMKSSTQPSSSHSAQQLKLGFCPLNLVSDDKIKVATAASIVLELCRPEERDNELIRGALVDFLYRSPLLRKLRDLQITKDSVGVLKAELSQRDFLTAMTIRDCTLFLKVSRSIISPPKNIVFSRLFILSENSGCGSSSRKDLQLISLSYFQVPRSGHGAIEARLGDLDLKTSGGLKAEYWRGIETRLIDGGWYTGTEKDMGGPKNSCQLSL